MKKILTILTISILLIGCRTELDYKGPNAEPMMYVYALFDNDTLNYVFVGQTSFFLDYIPTTQCFDDAKVSIQINNGEATKLTYNRDTSLYVFNKHLSTGDTLRLTVNHPKYGSAEAVAVVPPEVAMTIKEVNYFVEGEELDNYAVIDFSTSNLNLINNYYFYLEPILEMRVFSEVYDGEHWNPKTWEYDKDWTTKWYHSYFYYPAGLPIAAEETATDYADIWELMINDIQDVKRFDMKGNVVECKMEFYEGPLEHYLNDSLEYVIFHSDITVCSPEYVKYIEQCDIANSESINPFVEPTQVVGNLKPLGDKPVFGFFAINRKYRASKYTSYPYFRHRNTSTQSF